MSQINGPMNGPNAASVAGTQPSLSSEAKTALKGRINEVVRQLEVLPYQARRAERTNAQQAGYVIGRVVGAVFTLGVSEGIIAIGHKAEQLNAQNLREQAVSRLTSAAHANEAVGRAVISGEGFPSPAYKAAMDEAVRDLKAKFPEQLENFEKFSDLPFGDKLKRAVKSELLRQAEPVSAELLKAIIGKEAVPFLGILELKAELTRAFKNADFPPPLEKLVEDVDFLANMDEMVDDMLQRSSLKEELAECTTSDAIRAAIGTHSEDILLYAFHTKAEKISVRVGMEHAVNLLANEFKLSAEEVRRFIPLTGLEQSLVKLAKNQRLPETGREECMGKAEEFVRAKRALFHCADSLQVPESFKTYWKNTALSQPDLTNPAMFENAVEAATDERVRNSAASFTALPDMDEDELTEEMLHARVQNLSWNLNDALAEKFGLSAWDRLGPEGRQQAFLHGAKALFALNPGIGEAFSRMNMGVLDERIQAEADHEDANLSQAAKLMRQFIDAFSTPKETNRQLAKAFEEGTLPPLYAVSLSQAEEAVFKNFPTVERPADLMGMKLGDMSVGEFVSMDIRDAEGAVSPERFAEILQTQLSRAFSLVHAADLVAGRAQVLGGEAISRKACEDIAETRQAWLLSTRSEADVKEVLAKQQERVDAYIREAQVQAVNDRTRTSAFEDAVKTLAANLGLRADEVRARMPAQLKELGDSLDQLNSVLKRTRNTPIDAVAGLYAERVDPFVQNITAAFYAVDELNISPELKAEWKERILSEPALADASLLKHAAKLGADLARQYGVGALVHNIGNAEGFYNALHSLPTPMGRLAQLSVSPQEWSRLGAEGQKALFGLALLALLDSQPGLLQQIRQNPDMLKAAGKMASDDILANMDDNDPQQLAAGATAVRTAGFLDALMGPAVSNADLAAGLEKPESLPAAYLQAFRQAEAEVRARFSGVELPENFMEAYPIGGAKVEKQLREAVKNSEGTLTPEAFAQLAGRFMNLAAASAAALSLIDPRLAQAVTAGTTAFTPMENWKYALAALSQRSPGVLEKLSTAASPQAVREVLDGEADLAPMVRVLADISRAWAAGERHMFRRMAEATGLPEEDVRARLDTTSMLRSNAFNFEWNKLYDVMKDPAQNLGVLPSAEELMQTYEGMAERFVSRKGALYQSVDGLPGLSAGYRESLKAAVFSISGLKQPFLFERCSRTAQGMYAAPLSRSLEGGADDAALLAEVGKLAVQYQNGSHIAFPDDILKDMDPDDTSGIQKFSLAMFMDMNPALKACLSPARYEALSGVMDREIGRLTKQLGSVQPRTPAAVETRKLYEQAVIQQALLDAMRQQ